MRDYWEDDYDRDDDDELLVDMLDDEERFNYDDPDEVAAEREDRAEDIEDWLDA